MRFLLLFCFFTCIISSCRHDCPSGDLTSYEQAGLPYGVQQQLIFYNETTLDYDTLSAEEKTFGWDASSSYDRHCPPSGTQYGNQVLFLYPVNADHAVYPPNTDKFTFSVRHENDGNAETKLICDYFPGVQHFDDIGATTINGNGYDHVIEATCDSAFVPVNGVWHFYFNREFGLLRFDLKRSGSWALVR